MKKKTLGATKLIPARRTEHLFCEWYDISFYMAQLNTIESTDNMDNYMYIIALDEQGNFEDPNNEEKMVAGLIYKGTEQDIKEERRRIEVYFRMLCDSVNDDLKTKNPRIAHSKLVSYPDDLHLQNKHGSKSASNGANVNAVKTKMAQTIGEFLAKGSYNGKQIRQYKNPQDGSEWTLGIRGGDYYIYANLCSKNGKQKLLGNHVGKLVKDDFASNLYIHMAEDVISRLLFHNPLFEMDNVRLNLATRSLPVGQESGHAELRMKGNESFYSITNQDTYRSAIGREMLSSGKVNKDITLDVRSIIYSEEKQFSRDMVFLYLADMVCSVLTSNAGTYNNHSDFLNATDASRIDSLAKRAKALCGKDGLVFGYDSADEYFSNAWKAMENGDYFTAISYAYDGINYRSPKGGFTVFYKNRWFPQLFEQINSSKNIQYFRNAVNRLRDYSLEQHLNQDKLLFIYSKLKDSIEVQNGIPSDILFNLYDIGHTSYNHVGDPIKALECYEMSRRYGDGTDIETWIDTVNRGIVTMTDSFQYDSILEQAQNNVEMQKMIDELRNEQFTGSTHMTKSGFAYSQLGQVQAILGIDKAEESFHQALKLEKNNEQEYKKTLSYLLHYYIESGQKAKYQKEAVPYFGGHTTLKEQYHYLLEQASKGNDAEISANYGMYVFVKAYMHFYPDGFQNFTLPDIIADYTHAQGGIPVSGHPWEIIYKYLAINAYNKKKKSISNTLIRSASSVVSNSGFTIDAIVMFGEIQFFDATGQSSERDIRIKKLYEMISKESSDDISKMHDSLKKMIRYMYC